MDDNGRTGDLEWAARVRPHPDERVSGDRFAVVDGVGTVLFAVVDGLGHGPEAAAAATAATDVLGSDPAAPLRAVLWQLHRDLADTRGAAVTLGRLVLESRSLEWLGVGNVTGLLLRVAIGGLTVAATAPTVGGIIGFQLDGLPAPHRVTVAPGDLVTLATDGVRPGFERGLPMGLPAASVADEVIQRCATEDDDALVLVARHRGRLE